jgi:hypothetical protein
MLPITRPSPSSSPATSRISAGDGMGAAPCAIVSRKLRLGGQPLVAVQHLHDLEGGLAVVLEFLVGPFHGDLVLGDGRGEVVDGALTQPVHRAPPAGPVVDAAPDAAKGEGGAVLM